MQKTLTTLLLLLLVLSLAHGEEDKYKPVSIQLKWKPNFQFAGYFMALEKGFYQEEGLKVTIVEGGPGVDFIGRVVSGKSQYGTGMPELMLERYKGLPVIILCPIFQHSPEAIATLKSSGIFHPQHLYGKMLAEPAKGTPAIKAMLKREGINIETGITTLGTYILPDKLKESKADAMTVYEPNQPFVFKQLGLDINIIRPIDYGIDFYGDCLFTTQKELKQNPDRVKAFYQATIKGWKYAFDHPEETINHIMLKYPSPNRIGYHSREHLEYQCRILRNITLPDLVAIGHSNPGRWKHIRDTYVELGLLPADYDVTPMLYDPDPQQDYTIFKWAAVISILVLAISSFIIIVLSHFNRRLQQTAEIAKTANQAKSEFLANMSHEIRTPMNAVLGFAEILKGMEGDPKKSHYIDNIHTSGKALLNLINDILDLSKIEAGKLELHYNAASIPSLLNEMHTIFNQKITDKGLQLIIDVDPEFPQSLILDETRIRQVLVNLIGNAFKFTDRGHIRLKASAKKTDNLTLNRYDLILAVEDTGAGIPEDQQDTIFGAFIQTKGQKTAQFGGTGLGLAICSSLVKMMNGRLSVTSQIGRGSTFHVSLPGIEVAATDAITTEGDTQLTFSDIHFEKASILICDDIDFNREMLTAFLADWDFTIIYAENGKECLQQTQSQQPDVILLDMKMPVMNGYEAAEMLKANKQFKEIPVIAVTASALKQDEVRIAKLCDGYLRKPVSQNELIREVMRFLPHTITEHKDGSEANPQDTAKGSSADLPEECANLPDEWRKAAIRLAETGLYDDLNAHLNEINNDFPAVAAVIQYYLSVFRFDRIVELLEERKL